MINYSKLFYKNSLDELRKNHNWSKWINDEIFVFNLINKTNFKDFELIDKKIFNKPAILISSLEKLFLTNSIISSSLSDDDSFCMYCCSLDVKYAKIFQNAFEKNEKLVWWYINEYSNKCISEFLPEKYLKNEKVVNYLCFKNINNFKFIDHKFKNDLLFYNNLSDKLSVFPFVGDNINNNWDICFDIVFNNTNYYPYISESLQKNPDFFLSVLEKMKNNNKISEQILNYDMISLLNFSHDNIKDNEHCVWQAVLFNPKNLKFASSRLLKSTSFALQVIGSLNNDQINESFNFWDIHVRNNLLTMGELLPKILKSSCLNLVGPEVKENYHFMLKSMLLDSKQTLSSCPSILLENSNFLIDSYNLINEKNRHKNIYDSDSEQSSIFNFITQKSTNDEFFISNLYKTLNDVFIYIIYPKIKDYDTSLIHSLNISNKDNNLIKNLENMVLQNNLKVNLVNNHNNKKKIKI